MAYLDHLKQSRESSAVQKLRLAALRANLPTKPIFALEGDDDKTIYCRWFSRIRPEMQYEPFLCKGKRGVRQLKNSLAHDLGDLEENVYFFVDRDFDDLLEFVNNINVFMTEMYSVENYLVLPQVLESILRDDFPCHELPELRAKVVGIYSDRLAEFIHVSRDFNRRLFIARKLDIPLERPLPKRISSLARVNLMSIEASETPSEDIVVYSAEPPPDKVEEVLELFETLDGIERYRGKNAFLFFKAWHDRLCQEYETPAHAVFAEVKSNTKIRRAEFVLGSLAARSPIPDGLQGFLAAIPA